jgi:alpha-ketoglutarate-dependent taurine dioxygenase
MRFAEYFAPILLPLIDSGGTDNPGITVLDQTDPKGQYTERCHSDSTFLAEPPLGAVLQAKQLPSLGGDTCWASMYAAYDALSPAMQQFAAVLTRVLSARVRVQQPSRRNTATMVRSRILTSSQSDQFSM